MTNDSENTEGFPRALLRKSLEERYEYFENFSAAHTVLENSFQKLIQTILVPAGKKLVFIIGPPGVGKTFLLKWIEDEIKSFWASQQDSDRGRIPVVGIEVPSKDRMRPSCGDIYLRLLRALEEPLIDKKIVYGDVTLYQTFNNQTTVDPRLTAPKLRYALEQACIHRKPFLLSLDEAQHLMNIAGLSFEELMDWVKSLANMCKVMIGLFGTYEMFALLDLNDQLTRRTRIIHLRRYSNEGTDCISFQRAVLSFQQNLPFEKEPDLLASSDYLYERTVGCIGNLYDWLLSAFHLALHDSEANTLEYKHLRESVPLTSLQAAKMNKSFEDDELRFLKTIGEEDEDIDDENGANVKAATELLQHRADTNHPPTGKKSSTTKTPKKRKGRVGKRNPVRDKTGRNDKTEI